MMLNERMCIMFLPRRNVFRTQHAFTLIAEILECLVFGNVLHSVIVKQEAIFGPEYITPIHFVSKIYKVSTKHHY